MIQAALFETSSAGEYFDDGNHPPFVRETPDGLHRIWLDRLTGISGPRLGWVMCNPSTADATHNDPTIRKVIGFTLRALYGCAVVGNLYTFRSTDPAGLDAAAPNANHAEANEALRWLAGNSDAIVLAWGSGSRVHDHKAYQARANDVTEMLRDAGAKTLLALGETSFGFPRHPLFVPYSRGMGIFPLATP